MENVKPPTTADFGIVLDSHPLRAGAVLSGKIWVHLRTELPGCHLKAALVGSEIAQIGGSRSERPLMYVNIPVNDNEVFGHTSRVVPGRYVCPFEIELPSFLPASFLHVEMDKDTCAVDYRIKASLQGDAPDAYCACEQPVDVWAAPIDERILPYSGQPVSSSQGEGTCCCCCCPKLWLRFCGCCCCCGFGSGAGASATLAGRMDTTVIEKGKNARMTYTYRNENVNKEDISKIRVQVVQSCAWKAQNRQRRSSEVTLQQVTLTLPPGDRPVKEGDADLHTEMLNELLSGKGQQTLEIPLDAFTTYTGAVVEVNHDLVMSFLVEEDEKKQKKGGETPEPLMVVQARVPIHVSESRAVKRDAAQTPQTVIPDLVVHVLPDDFLDPSATVTHANLISIPVEDVSTGGAIRHGKAPYDGPKSNENVKPSFSALLKETTDSVAGAEVVGRRKNEINWKPFLETMSPADYGAMVRQIRSPVDQPDFAVLVAGEIQEFSCRHAAAAIKNAHYSNRCVMVDKLSDLCVDLHKSEGQNAILSVLTEWEKLVVDRSFKQMVKRKGG